MEASGRRIFFYILFAIIISVFIPIEVRMYGQAPLLESPVKQNMYFLLILAVLVSAFSWERIKPYARTRAAVNVILCVSLSYFLIFVFLLLTRVEYSRTVVFISFFVNLIWFLFIHLWEQKFVRHTYGIILGGKLRNLRDFKQTSFKILRDVSDSAANIEYIKKWDGIIADLRYDHGNDVENLFAQLTLEGIRVYHFRQLEEVITGRVSIEKFTENTHGTLLPSSDYRFVKCYLDCLLIFLLSPIILAICLFVVITILVFEGAPVIFRQHRVGYLGKPFIIYKFRTMLTSQVKRQEVNSDETINDDPRITRIGNFLRKTRLDEIPQLLNVLKGEMSIVGPRPEATSLSNTYQEHIALYKYRFSVKPGITGWAQVQQGHVTSVDGASEKLSYDLYYIKHFSFWLDLLILRKTITTIFTGFGAK